MRCACSASRSSTTADSRSTCASAAVASSRTALGSSVATISSSRIDSAVSGRAQLVRRVGGELPLGGDLPGRSGRRLRRAPRPPVELARCRSGGRAGRGSPGAEPRGRRGEVAQRPPSRFACRRASRRAAASDTIASAERHRARRRRSLLRRRRRRDDRDGFACVPIALPPTTGPVIGLARSPRAGRCSTDEARSDPRRRTAQDARSSPTAATPASAVRRRPRRAGARLGVASTDGDRGRRRPRG